MCVLWGCALFPRNSSYTVTPSKPRLQGQAIELLHHGGSAKRSNRASQISSSVSYKSSNVHQGCSANLEFYPCTKHKQSPHQSGVCVRLIGICSLLTAQVNLTVNSVNSWNLLTLQVPSWQLKTLVLVWVPALVRHIADDPVAVSNDIIHWVVRHWRYLQKQAEYKSIKFVDPSSRVFAQC